MAKKEEEITIKFKSLNSLSKIPEVAYGDSGCFDLVCTSCYFDRKKEVLVYGFGAAMEFPKTAVLNLFPRSSISDKDLILTNSVGQGDHNYRGEYLAKFKFTKNFDRITSVDIENGIVVGYKTTIEIVKKKFLFGLVTLDTPKYVDKEVTFNIYKIGDRICQGRLSKVYNTKFESVNELSETSRGTGGYGSSGN